MAPIDKNLINQDLLSENERNWINDYHKKVFINLKDSMNKRGNIRFKRCLFSYLKFLFHSASVMILTFNSLA